MKMIIEGDSLNWWHGRKATCPECRRVVELEPGDDQSVWWVMTRFSHVDFLCQKCGVMNIVHRLVAPPGSVIPLEARP